MQAEILPRCCLAQLMPLAMVLLLFGCGTNGTLTGKVTYKGEPMPRATVSFLCENQQAFTVKCDDKGDYTIKLPIGRAQVVVNNVDQVAPAIMGKMMTQQQGGKDATAEIAQSIQAMQMQIGSGGAGGVAVPGKYNRLETSGLTVDVAGGKQRYDIALRD
jgi:hypothetical protein